MRKENAQLEASVTAMDSKAKVVRAGADARVAALKDAVRVAATVEAAGVGEVGEVGL
jgi:hypothetical protein